MSYGSLLNNLCSWTRQSYNESALNEYNEPTEEVTVISENVLCRVEKLYEKELLEAYAGGDHDKGLYMLFLPRRQDIRSGDTVTVTETVRMGGFSITGIDGMYTRSSTFFNDKPAYEKGDYLIFYNDGHWVVKNVETDEEHYHTTLDSLNTKAWVPYSEELDVYAGKSVQHIVQDFHYTNQNSNDLIVIDVEDAGGGQRHHTQCMCRYRQEIR